MQHQCQRCSLLIDISPSFSGREIRCPDCGLIGILPPSYTASTGHGAVPPVTAGHGSLPGYGSLADYGSSEDVDDLYQPLPRRKKEDAEMDMTPMVDVVFLLLIFFMITASFGLQKSIEVPPPDKEQSAQQASSPQQPEKQEEEIVVNVTQENRIFVEGEEAPTRQELYARLRDRQHQGGRQANRLLVVADSEASHEFVVRALDAGNVVGMESVRIQTTE